MAGDEEKEEEWSEEDDRLEHKFIKRIMKKMDQEERREEEQKKVSREAKEKLQRIQQSHGVARVVAPSVAGYGGGGGATILIRPIENGFVVSYIEVDRPPESAVDSEERPEYVTPEAPGVGGLYIPARRMEVFVKDSTEAVSVVGKAMDAARALHKLQNGGESAFV